MSAAVAYAKAIAGDYSVDANNIAALSPYTGPEDSPHAMYIVIWRGDIGCGGGSDGNQNLVATIRVGAGASFLVDPSLSSPSVAFNVFPYRHYPRLTGYSHNTITLSGLADDPTRNEGLCCPSLPLKVTAQVDRSGNWRVLRKVSKGR